MQDGKWVLTDLALENAVERLEKHRKDCRERYRHMREALKTQRPDLFNKKNGCSRDRTVVRESQLSIRECLPQSPQA